MGASEEEFVPEEAASSSDEELEDSGPGLIKRLREKLKKAVDEKQEYLEGWQRARADFANYKKEEASMHADREARLTAKAVEEMLPALDALELARKHSPDDATLAMLEKQFIESLKRLGVERFGSVGDEFDPSLHEALAMKGEDHLIQSVERSGYKIGSTIIRAAQVII